MTGKQIIITGVTGQDGSHMADYLLDLFSRESGVFKIYGAIRRLSVSNHENILHLKDNPNFELIDMDLNDAHSIRDVIIDIQPDYFINFVSQSRSGAKRRKDSKICKTESASVPQVCIGYFQLPATKDWAAKLIK